MKVKLKNSVYTPAFSFSNRLARIIWTIFYFIFFRLSPIPFFSYRRRILLCFGAKLAAGAYIYPSAKIWSPKNLTMAAGSTVGPKVNIYNQGAISIGHNAIISQGAYLCASTHDYNDPLHPLILAPIVIESNVWICAEAFVGPGVKVLDGGVVGARAVVLKDTDSWGVYTGNPATKIKNRSRFN
jgi:putative colanic acid biosynthesis acetyltransferase WcaF